jgi:CD2 antigen cytoplasmic tail-binding protein 2
MSGGSSSRSTDNPPAKRLRFPKGKKGKPIGVIVKKVIVEENVNDLSNPVVAAKERMKRRNQITAELLSEEISNNISAAEVKYKVCFFRVFFDLSR